jgi:hemolysin activation/secretion protein
VALPLTEQIGLGNNSLVRGYTLDDGAFDAGVVSRNELRGPSFALFGRAGRIIDQLSPYVFFDAGYGKDRTTKTDAAPISTGLGADYQLTTHLTATLDGAWALRSVGFTRSGDARLESRVTFSF